MLPETSRGAITTSTHHTSIPWLAVQIVYYDGQFDDARLNVSLACTAALAGAAIVNYAEVTELLKV